MTRPLYIAATDPLCQELQGGHDSYHLGLLIADGHTVGPDGGFLIDAPDAAKLATGYRRPEQTTANVHPISNRPSLPDDARRIHNHRKVYGVRFWTTTNQQENIMDLPIDGQDIAALGREAATHGDSTMDETCQQALAGSEDAWQECADIIAATRREAARN